MTKSGLGGQLAGFPWVKVFMKWIEGSQKEDKEMLLLEDEDSRDDEEDQAAKPKKQPCKNKQKKSW